MTEFSTYFNIYLKKIKVKPFLRNVRDARRTPGPADYDVLQGLVMTHRSLGHGQTIAKAARSPSNDANDGGESVFASDSSSPGPASYTPDRW